MINKKLIFYFSTFFITYLLYVYPIYMLSHLLFDTVFFNISSIFLLIGIYAVITYYYKSSSTFFGVGAFAFTVNPLAITLNVLRNYSTTANQSLQWFWFI